MAGGQTIAALVALCICALFLLRGNAAAAQNTEKIAIIKADDVRSADGKWNRFVELSAKRKVNVSLGIVVDSQANPSAKTSFLER